MRWRYGETVEEEARRHSAAAAAARVYSLATFWDRFLYKGDRRETYLYVLSSPNTSTMNGGGDDGGQCIEGKTKQQSNYVSRLIFSDLVRTRTHLLQYLRRSVCL